MPRSSRLSVALSILLAASLPLAASFSQADEGKVRLHQYTTGNLTWGANAFWLESNTGIVLIDALLLKSDATALAAAIQSTGKPLAGILLTHPHGDHFGGIPTLRAALGDVPVFATRTTAEQVAPIFLSLSKAPWTARRFGADFPSEAMTPDHIVASGEVVELAGMHFTLSDLGPMETTNNTVIENMETGALFTGDATVSGALFYVGEGFSCQALGGLKRLREKYDANTMTYSGHYAPMRLGVIVDDNIAQIRYTRKVVLDAFADPANLAADGSLTDVTRDRLVKQVASHLSDHADYGIGPEGAASSINLPGLEQEIKREISDKKPCGA